MLCAAFSILLGSQDAGNHGLRFIDNGKIRLGVNLDEGGAITYLAPDGKPNLVNDFDLGRQIQMSYYSGPVPFEPNDKMPQSSWAGLGWNPIQSGDCFGNHSRTIEFRSNKDSIYVKSIPMQWPLSNEPGECAFEARIKLVGNTVEVRSRIDNDRSDRTQYSARGQELPAVYTNGPWYRLVSYVGSNPFTDDAVADIPATFPWSGLQATENWAALLDDSGFGLGLWAPGVQTFSGGFAGSKGAGGPKDSPTGYIAPNYVEILDHNIRYDNRYVLIVGSLSDIRSFVDVHGARPMPPEYRFDRDRQHWYYANASDTGWPIKGELRVKEEQSDPQLIGPAGFWQAVDAPRIYIKGSFKQRDGRGRLFWSRFDSPGFTESRAVDFQVIPDGKERIYTVDLATQPEYRGVITGLRFDPEPWGQIGDMAYVRSIGFKVPD